jgi:hypothetical protein
MVGGLIIGLSFNVYAQESSSIPNWIKSTTKLWINGDVSDNDFEKEIQYLIEHKIITISQIQQNSQSIQRVPHWVKNLAGMWVNGTSSNDDFTKAIEYMVNVGIITVNVPSTLTNAQNQTTVNVQNQTTSAPITSVTMVNHTNSSSVPLNSITQTNNVPSLLGSGINLNIVNNTASGFLTLAGKHYDAPNLTVVIKGDEITLTGYVQGSFNVLLMATGVHTSGIIYNFNGAIMNNGNSVPVTFTASLTTPAKQSITNVISTQNISSTPAQNIHTQASGIPMLMLTTHNDQVYMAYPYTLVVKIFDPQSNPQKIFDQFTGGISDVNITATVLDPNNEIIGQSVGKTDSKGIYQVGITMPYTEWQQEQLQVMINATKKGYTTQSTTLPLLLIHPNNGGSAPVCSVSTSSLLGGTNGTPYSQTLSSSNCNSPVTWAIQSGSLPTGLTLHAGTGVIDGTPTGHGLSSFVVQVTSSDGRVASASLSINIP